LPAATDGIPRLPRRSSQTKRGKGKASVTETLATDTSESDNHSDGASDGDHTIGDGSDSDSEDSELAQLGNTALHRTLTSEVSHLSNVSELPSYTHISYHSVRLLSIISPNPHMSSRL
jgi:hypothetical protein